MKCRMGFVSNSSSSSFVVVMTEGGYEQAYKQLEKELQKVLDKVVQKEKLGGLNVHIFSDFSDMGGGSAYDEDHLDLELPLKPVEERDDPEDEDERYSVSEITDKLIGLIPEGESFTTSQDW